MKALYQHTTNNKQTKANTFFSPASLSGTNTIQRKKLYWEDHSQLTWNDFKGKPDSSSKHDAATETGYEMPKSNLTLAAKYGTKNEKCKLGQKEELEYFARVAFDPKRNNVRAFVETDKSWVKSDKKVPSLLRHEQGHFDISNVMSERFQAKIFAWGISNRTTKKGCGQEKAAAAARKAFEAKDFVKAIQEIGKKAISIKDKAQADYERETAHGSKRAQQIVWEEKIKHGLLDYLIK